MLLLARPSGLAIYCSQVICILRNFDVRAVYNVASYQHAIFTHGEVMQRQPILLSLGMLLASGILTSCGPQFQTNYTYYPPESPSGQTCIFQCQNGKLQCQQLRDMEYERCIDRADREYYRCQDMNLDLPDKKKEYCYRAYCNDADYERCEAGYRSCYQACGGRVESETVCVSGCEQQKGTR